MRIDIKIGKFKIAELIWMSQIENDISCTNFSYKIWIVNFDIRFIFSDLKKPLSLNKYYWELFDIDPQCV